MSYKDFWPTMDDKYADLREELGKRALSEEAFPGLETLEVINEETSKIWEVFRRLHELGNPDDLDVK